MHVNGIQNVSKRIAIALILLLFQVLRAEAQTFTGTSTDNYKAYEISMRINEDSSIHFIYNRPGNSIYADYRGSLKQKGGHLYQVNADMQIGQFSMKSFHPDTFYIQMEEEIALQLDKIQLEFSDKSTMNYQGYTRDGKAIKLIKVPINKRIFSAKKGLDVVNIRINRRSFITYEFLVFKIPFGSGASFTSAEKISIELRIQHGEIISVGNPPIQTGHFKLNRIN